MSHTCICIWLGEEPGFTRHRGCEQNELISAGSSPASPNLPTRSHLYEDLFTCVHGVTLGVVTQ